MANKKIKAELEIEGKDDTEKAFKSVALRMGQIERQMSRFNKTAGDFQRKVASIEKASSGRQMGAAYQQMKRIGDGMASAAAAAKVGIVALGGAAVAGGVKRAVMDFAALEREMTRIGITADASAEETKKAFEQAQQVAKDLKFDSVQPAIEALDTLTASGMSLKEAMAFLPSVMATAQASGAATSDIANTALKAASALKIEAGEMQKAFDIMVMGGKAGQFELKDMASFIPSLASSFATLGYSGEDGLKQLVALLQTLRTSTGTAGEAATQAANIFGKIYSEETAKKFSNFGIDLRKEMEAAKKSGEDTLGAFIRLSQEAVNGDMSRLPLLFSDQEFRLGMQTLMLAPEKLQEFYKVMNSSEVSGTVFRDLNKVMSDTQSSIDSLSNSWGRLMTSIGAAVAENGGIEAMNWATNKLDYHTAVNRGLEKNGVNGFMARTGFGITSSQLEKDRMAIAGGYSDPAFIADYNQRLYESGTVKASTGRQGRRVVLPEFPGGGTGAIPTPMARPTMPAPVVMLPAETARQMQDQYLQYGAGRQSAMAQTADLTSANPFRAFEDRLASATTQAGDAAGQKIADGGEKGASALEQAAESIRQAGLAAAEAIQRAAVNLASPRPAMASGVSASPVNANTGRSMPPSTFGPR